MDGINIVEVSKPYSCPEEGCNKTYRGISNLNWHLKRYHGQGSPKYVCQAAGCGKGFYTPHSYKVHQRVHGENLLMFTCSEPGCDKSFSSSSRLKQHERLHKGTAFLCSYCSKEFSNQSDLKKHERVHSGEKPYKCKECNQSFKVPHHLREHQRKHTDDRPHVCQVKDCDAKYRRADALRKHMTSRHPELRTDEDLTTFLNSMGIKTISDMLRHESLKNAIDELRPGLDMLAELAATSDICRCDPCLCDPNKPNSVCNCILESDNTLRILEVPKAAKKSSCCSGSKGGCCGGKKDIISPKEILSSDRGSGSLQPLHSVNSVATSYSATESSRSVATSYSCNENGFVSVDSQLESDVASSYSNEVNGLTTLQNVSAESRAAFQTVSYSDYFGQARSVPSSGVIQVNAVSSVAAVQTTVESSTQYEDPSEFPDFSFPMPRSPWTPCEQATDTWDLPAAPSAAHIQIQTNQRITRVLFQAVEELPLDLTKPRELSREQDNCSALDASMLPSPCSASPRISDHEELNGMCSDGIQTTCCTSQSCTKPGILGLCNTDCNTFDSGCNEPFEGSCALKPGGCADKKCCADDSSCAELKKHAENNCCIVVCLNDLESNLPQGTISQA